MKKIVLMVAGYVLLGVAVFCGVKFFLDVYSPKNLETEQYGPAGITGRGSSLLIQITTKQFRQTTIMMTLLSILMHCRQLTLISMLGWTSRAPTYPTPLSRIPMTILTI